MMSNSPNLRQQYERRLDLLRRIDGMLDEDADFAAKLVDYVSSRLNSRAPTARKIGGKPTHFEKIKEYLVGRENRWIDAPTIMRATGLKRGGVSHVLYKTHTDSFEQKNHATNGKLKLWRLRREVMAREKVG